MPFLHSSNTHTQIIQCPDNEDSVIAKKVAHSVTKLLKKEKDEIRGKEKDHNAVSTSKPGHDDKERPGDVQMGSKTNVEDVPKRKNVVESEEEDEDEEEEEDNDDEGASEISKNANGQDEEDDILTEVKPNEAERINKDKRSTDIPSQADSLPQLTDDSDLDSQSSLEGNEQFTELSASRCATK
ncbi:unnamed protein product [Protopolystoma xenopodis]|uniref:Uncharacterized protein n=1 Tax=Protopolystoma xenopodis TaxID=117903 RepID=A0A3S5BDL9_9PLAT|nr:unnamed protein product [Protopolystoma xenopodis]